MRYAQASPSAGGATSAPDRAVRRGPKTATSASVAAALTSAAATPSGSAATMPASGRSGSERLDRSIGDGLRESRAI